MIDWDKPIETLDGRPARVAVRDRKTEIGTTHIVLAEVDGRSEEEALFLFETGSYSAGGKPVIRNKRREVEATIFCNVYVYGSDIVDVWTYTTRAKADAMATTSRFACIEINRTVTEGEGLG